jgi:invasion protein IalB
MIRFHSLLALGLFLTVNAEAGAQMRPAEAPVEARSTVQFAQAARPQAPAAAEAEKARLLEKSDDWSVFVHEGADGKVCFASSTPKDMEPKGARRSTVYFYVTTWQKDGVRNEVSVKLGYPLKADSTPVVTVGDATFEMFPREDKAFIKNPVDERKLLQTMLASGSMVVKATSARGTDTTDQYSLIGMSKAIKKLEEVCP